MFTLTVPSRLEREFKAAAKAAYPRETFAYGLGVCAGDQLYLDEWWWPDDLERYCSEWCVMIQPHWIVEAVEAARESGLVVCLDGHSHGYRAGEHSADRSQSEADIDRLGRPFVAAVCTVQPVKRNGRKVLRASMRWWGPTVPVVVKRG